MLDERKLMILYAIIENYTLTAQPIGSKTLLDKYDLGVSSATVRNDMVTLEEMGFIQKNHTSSGRIPSDKAYRFYVDKLIEDYQKESLANNKLAELIEEEIHGIWDIVEKSTKFLSEVTKHTALAVIRSDTNSVLQRINLSRIDKYLMLIILIFSSKDIVYQSFPVEKPLEDDDIQVLNKRLNTKVGVSLSEYIQAYQDLDHEDVRKKDLHSKIGSILEAVLDQRQKTEIMFEGVSNIFNYPEYSDTEKARDFFDFIEDENAIEGLMEKDKDKELSVNIGQENSDDNLNDKTVITSQFGFLGNRGRIGIIGPTRMDYDSVLVSILSIASTLKAVEENS